MQLKYESAEITSYILPLNTIADTNEPFYFLVNIIHNYLQRKNLFVRLSLYMTVIFQCFLFTIPWLRQYRIMLFVSMAARFEWHAELEYWNYLQRVSTVLRVPCPLSQPYPKRQCSNSET